MAMAEPPLSSQISISWVLGITGNTPGILQKFAAQGQSVFYGSGDSGAYQNGFSASYASPTSVLLDGPYITVVGGTELTTNGPGGPWLAETAWAYSGGGSSLFEPIPAYQQGINMAANLGSTTNRNIPDVAMAADGIFAVYYDGSPEGASGTSAATPLWAGYMALVNQQLAANGMPPIGFANPLLYSIGQTQDYMFHDITQGNNGFFPAVPGYDLVTGWGSPASCLYGALTGSPPCPSPTPTLTPAAPAGTGTGLCAQYYPIMTPSGSPCSSETANEVNWTMPAAGLEAPGCGVLSSDFSIRYTGYVQPQYNEAYTFYVNVDNDSPANGVTLTLYNNGTPIPLINPTSVPTWTGQEASTPVVLAAGTRYPMELDYTHSTGKANASLLWSSADQAYEVIPQSQLYPNCVATPTPIVTPTFTPTGSATPTPTPIVTLTFTPTGSFTPTPTPTFALLSCSQVNSIFVDQPEGVALDRVGNIYVADDSTGLVDQFSPQDNPQVNFGANVLVQPMGVAVNDVRGLVYVTDQSENLVYVFNNEGGGTLGNYVHWGGLGTNPGQFDSPSGIAVNLADNTLYVADSGNQRVQVFQAQGTQWAFNYQIGPVFTTSSGSSAFGYPLGVALDAGGDIYVTDYDTNLVQVFNAQGTWLRQWDVTQGTSLLGANFIAVYQNCLVYVSDGFGSVGVFDTYGNVLGVSQGGDTAFGDTEGLALNSNGWYAADGGNGQVYQFNACPLGNCATATPTPAASLWVEATSEAPFRPRSYHGSVFFNNELWVIGGQSPSTFTAASIFYTTNEFSDVWASPNGVNWSLTNVGAPFGGRDSFGALVYNNEIWVIGGRAYDNFYHNGQAAPYAYFNDVWSSPDGVNWTQMTASAAFSGRSNLGAVVFPDPNNSNILTMWVIGGISPQYDSQGVYQGTQYLNDVWSSTDGINWNLRTSNGPSYANFGYDVFNNAIWLFGGDQEAWSSDGVNWNTATNNAAFGDLWAVVYNNNMWLLGGLPNGGGLSSSVWFSNNGSAWNLQTSSPGFTPRAGLTSVSGNNRIWVIGGQDNTGVKNDVWYYQNPNIPTFTPLPTVSPTPTFTPTPILMACPQVNSLSVAQPEGVALDTAGNVYVVNNATGLVNVFNPQGTPIAGPIGSGYLTQSMGVAVDGNGLVYVTGSGGVYVFNSLGNGGSYLTYYNDGMSEAPAGIAVTANNSDSLIYVADMVNQLVWENQFNSSQSTWSYIGYIGYNFNATTGPSSFDMPVGVALDAAGNVYVADYGTGYVQVFNSQGVWQRNWDVTQGTSNGPTPLLTADFISIPPNCPLVYVTDGFGAVGIFDEYGNVQGSTQGWNEPLADPEGIAVGNNGWYVADNGNGQVYQYGSCPLALCVTPGATPTNTPLTPPSYYSFTAATGGSGSGLGQFNQPQGVAVVSSGIPAIGTGGNTYSELFVADTGNNRVETMSVNGTGPSTWGGPTPGTGNGQFNAPSNVVADNQGNIYVADTGNNRVQVFNLNGTFQYLFGGYGTGNGQFNSPNGLAADTTGHLYVADSGNNRVQQFTVNSTSSAYLTQWGGSGSGNGQFNDPIGLARDSNCYIYAADSGNYRIQKFNSSGVYQGQWGSQGSGNGQFKSPRWVAVGTDGHIYVSDSVLDTIQQFNSGGTYLAQVGASGSGYGQFTGAGGVAFDNCGNLYAADTGDNRIEDWNVSGSACPPTSTNTWTPTNTRTNTPTLTPTNTPTNTPTITPTFTNTFTPTATPTFGWVTVGASYGALHPILPMGPSLAMASGTPYVAFPDSGFNGWLVEYNGGAWTTVGGSYGTLHGTTNGTGTSPSLAFAGGTPYVAFCDSSLNGWVADYSGAAWSTVGGSSYGSNTSNDYSSPSLAISSGTPYVAFMDNNEKGWLVEYNGSAWATLGGGSYGTADGLTSPSLVVYEGTPYVAFAASNHVMVVEYNGSGWTTIGGASFASVYNGNTPSLALPGGVPYVAYADSSGKGWVATYNGSSWVTLGGSFGTPNYATYNDPSLAFSENTPYVSFCGYDTDTGWVVEYNGSAWVTVGSSYTTTEYEYGFSTLSILNGMPCVAYQDTSHNGWLSIYTNGVPFATATPTSTYTFTNTPTWTFTPTKTFSPTPTFTNNFTPTPTYTATSTATLTPTNTATNTATNTPTYTLTNTATNTPTLTPTNTPTNTATNTATNSPTYTFTLTPVLNTPTNTYTPTRTYTATFTYTSTKTTSPTPKAGTKTWTPTFTYTPTWTYTPTPTYTPTQNTPTLTYTSTKTATATVTPTPAKTNTPTNTATKTLTSTATKTPTSTPTKTPTFTPTNTIVGGPDQQVVPAMDYRGPGTPTATAANVGSVVAAPNVSRDGEPIQFLFNLEQPAWIRLSIYSLVGEQVYNVSTAGNMGSNKLVWSLQNQDGANVASGLYIYALRIENAGGDTAVKIGKVAVLH